MQCVFCSAESPSGATRCATCGAAFTPATDPGVLQPGTVLQNGTYAVGRCVGRGGFGITYTASDQALGRKVAIKEYFPLGCWRDTDGTVKPGGPAFTQATFQDGCSRFIDEGKALARFDHPSIVRIFTAFEENNTAYIVMEFLEGITLERLLADRGGPLPVAEARICAHKIGAALEVVHAANLLHRDIKPGNVMVVGGSSLLAATRIVLFDFGSAREYAAGQPQTHSIVLTPGYAPLEQYTRQAARGPYSDIYALAALLYHVLTGSPPPAATDRAFQCAIPDIRNQRPDLEGALGAGIMQGLEMEVHKRPQSIPEFLALIDAPPLPTQTAPPPPGREPGNATHATGGGAPLIGASPAARSTPQPVASASTVSEALGCVIVGSCFLLLLFGLLALLAYNHKGESYRPPPDPRRSTPTRVLLDPAGAKREIQARYDAMSAAMKAKNPRAYLEVLHENYRETDEKGRSQGRKDEASLKKTFEEMEKSKATLTVKVVDCQVKGNTATVNTEQVLAGSQPDPQAPAGNHKLVVKARTTDTWSKTPSGWKLTKQKVGKTTMTIDGKTPEEFARSQAAARKSEIQARYDAMCAAMKAKDPWAYLEIVHENYREIDEKGHFQGRKDEADLKRVFEKMEKGNATLSVTVVRCQVKEDTAAVNTEQVMTGSIPDPEDPAKTHEIVAKAKTADTWIRTGTGWRLLEERTLKTTTTIDGKSPEEFQKSQARAKAGDDTAPKAGKDTGDNSDRGEGTEKPAD